MLCAGVTVYSALQRSLARAGQWVVITGAGGGLGHLAVQLASRGMGMRVVGIDHPSKRDLVLESGALHFVDMTQFSNAKDTGSGAATISAHVKELCDGLGAHAAIVCTSSNQSYAQALECLRFNGRLVCVGIPHGEAPIATASPGSMIANQLTIIGSAVGNRQDAIDTLDFAARGVLKCHTVVEKMGNLTTVFDDMQNGRLQGRVVLDLA